MKISNYWPDFQWQIYAILMKTNRSICMVPVLVTGLTSHSMALHYKCLKWSAIPVPSQANKVFKTMDNFQFTPFSRITWNLGSRRTSQPWEVHSVSLQLSWSSAVMATKDLGGHSYSLQQTETQCESTGCMTQVSLMDAHMPTNDSEYGHEVGLRRQRCQQESTNENYNLKKQLFQNF